MIVWQGLLLVYRRLDVRLPGGRHFRHSLSAAEVEDGVGPCREVPALVERLSAGEASLELQVVEVDRALDSLTAMGEGIYWPSPSDTRMELDRQAPAGSVDSLFVLWPQNDFAAGTSVPSGGWGLAIRPSDWSNGATYATVANAQAEVWAEPVPGEVWLHEWLHGVCDLYEGRGYPMPPGNADGAERAGYQRSVSSGWAGYYRDLMTGQVVSGGHRLGITPQAWRTGAIVQGGRKVGSAESGWARLFHRDRRPRR